MFNTEGFQNARNFNEGVKYVTRGVIKGNERIFLRPDSGSSPENDQLLSSIVVTEDAISAIKVSRTCNAVAAHKATIGLELILRLSREFKHLIIWLDSDRQSFVQTEATRAIPYFESVKVVRTKKDPKEYSNKEIESFLTS